MKVTPTASQQPICAKKRALPNGIKGMFDFHCISKKANLPGLQLADLVARPIGVHYLHPEQHNRAWEMLLPKMRTSHDGKLEGYGLKIYPQFDPTE